MPTPQPQPVLAPLTPAAIFLVVTIDQGGEEVVHDALAGISGLVRATGFRDPAKNLSVITSIGSHAWDRLFDGPRPAELHPFVELDGPRHTAPATPGRPVVPCSGRDAGRLLRAGQSHPAIDGRRGDRGRRGARLPVLRQPRSARDSSTEPRIPNGAPAVAATEIGDEDPEFAGGSYVHVQKYLHDMAAWDSLSVTEQEHVIGRTKLEDIEFDDDEKPANAHIALNVITDDDGTQLQIVRHNMPFGELGKGEFGTYFIGYSRTPAGDRADAAQHVSR